MLKNLGIAYFWNGDYEEAEKTLRESQRLSMKSKRQSAELYAYLGRLCFRKGDFEEALMFYERAAELGQKGLVNRMIAEEEGVFDKKELLEKNKDLLPFARAYVQQLKGGGKDPDAGKSGR